jgi:4-alpha-glucanotransferase
MQDLLMLGEKSRMNKPGTAAGNWQWRFCKKQLRVQHIKFLEEITIKFNRDWSATT